MIFGTASTGQDVVAIRLAAGDLSINLLTWGAILQDVRLAGVDRSLTLGSNNLADYEAKLRHHGSLIGPIANRISTGRVNIDGMMYELERNQGGRVHLHSGSQATHRRIWEVVENTKSKAVLRCKLVDGECGLPGNRVITATFAVTPPATLTLTIDGITDASTLMNFTNHSYWNLDGTNTWNGHRLRIDADGYLPTTADSFPTGDIVDVTGTDMDFRKPREITVNDPPFDNNFCLSDHSDVLRDALTLSGQSGVAMNVATNQPGIQIYDGRSPARPGHAPYEGLAIEAQGWPDAPNNPAFPSIRVTPERPYRHVTRFTFHNGSAAI